MHAAIALILMLQTVPATVPLPRITPRSYCPQGIPGEVVVCGRRDGGEQYRLPPSTRGQSTEIEETGSGASGAQILAGSGPCGIHAGQRRCAHGEAGRAGYGGGRDPLTMGRKILTRLIDADAEIDPPPSPPAGR
ncbi:hypothetical protein [Sphingomonas sp. SORGH_AS_0879]|uniref:hypothetical protein n=1 Tax=Sphingomonas sp. SORGH_AS_0879 TaxID=3041790 RepID=UPI00278802C8|nr:hypothetical protein [Sphingomonas sp. SORGH_AS_0879]MDQ1230207.1 hypothetical protein [Sphingomonas sp. SORGH_AS_0879]